jgi:hypothetical protein
MKQIVVIFLFFPFFVVFPQNAVNTIYISPAKAAYIIFPSDISEYQIGTRETQVHAKKMGNNVLSLQYTDVTGTYIETNLFVILKGGKIYYYDIRLDDKRENYTYNASEHVSVATSVTVATHGEKTGDMPESGTTEVFSETEDLPTTSFEKNYPEVMKLSDMFLGAEQRERKITLKLDAVAYADNYMYIKFTIFNRSDIDYVVEYVKFLRTTKSKAKKQSFQEIELPVVAKDRDVIRLLRDEKNTVIYVFDKLTLTEDEDLIIEIKENKGTRDFNFVIPHHFINHAKNIDQK